MGGIAGIVTASGSGTNLRIVRAMLRALAHRGNPDERLYAAGSVVFACCRGARATPPPEEHEAEAPWREDRDSLAARDAPPTGRAVLDGVGDAEAVVRLYMRHGLGFMARMRGAYAFALHDPHQDRVVIGHDPFGIKPLYYAERSQGIAFASEPDALVRAEFLPAALDPAVVAALLQLQYTTGASTIRAGIKRLLPGEALVVQGGHVVERRRLAALPLAGPANWTEDDALERLDDALTKCVAGVWRGARGTGLFLSGGVDSAALLTKLADGNGPRPQCMVTGCDLPAPIDKRAGARRVAHALRAPLTSLPFTEHDFWTLLPRVAAALDDPVADISALALYKLGAAARALGLTTIITGDGADELLAGYGRYRSVMRPWWRGGRNMRSRGTFEGLGVVRANLSGWRDGVTAAEAREGVGPRSRLQVAQAVDCADWLPNGALTRLDRCLSAHGIEALTPYLDPALAGTFFCLPDHLKIANGLGKWILRMWLDRRLPVANAFVKRRGDAIPVGDWIVQAGHRLGPLVAAQPGVAELCDSAAVEVLYRKHDRRPRIAAWTLLFYALWHQCHIVGLPPAPDVFETLAQS